MKNPYLQAKWERGEFLIRAQHNATGRKGCSSTYYSFVTNVFLKWLTILGSANLVVCLLGCKIFYCNIYIFLFHTVSRLLQRPILFIWSTVAFSRPQCCPWEVLKWRNEGTGCLPFVKIRWDPTKFVAQIPISKYPALIIHRNASYVAIVFIQWRKGLGWWCCWWWPGETTDILNMHFFKQQSPLWRVPEMCKLFRRGTSCSSAVEIGGRVIQGPTPDWACPLLKGDINWVNGGNPMQKLDQWH